MLKDILKGALGSATARKGQAGGIAGAVIAAGIPAADVIFKAIGDGFAAGAMPNLTQIGVILGQAVTGYALGFVTVWFAPPNRG